MTPQRVYVAGLCTLQGEKHRKLSPNVNQPAVEARFQSESITAKNVTDGMSQVRKQNQNFNSMKTIMLTLLFVLVSCTKPEVSQIYKYELKVNFIDGKQDTLMFEANRYKIGTKEDVYQTNALYMICDDWTGYYCIANEVKSVSLLNKTPVKQ